VKVRTVVYYSAGDGRKCNLQKSGAAVVCGGMLADHDTRRPAGAGCCCRSSLEGDKLFNGNDRDEIFAR